MKPKAQLPIWQLNCHNAKDAWTNLSIQLGKVSEGALTFLQEPYTCKGNVAKIGKGCQVLAKVECQARAAIITKNMNIGFCKSLSSRDIAGGPTTLITIDPSLNSGRKLLPN